jgi:hypothetical protein
VQSAKGAFRVLGPSSPVSSDEDLLVTVHTGRRHYVNIGLSKRSKIRHKAVLYPISTKFIPLLSLSNVHTNLISHSFFRPREKKVASSAYRLGWLRDGNHHQLLTAKTDGQKET